MCFYTDILEVSPVFLGARKIIITYSSSSWRCRCHHLLRLLDGEAPALGRRLFDDCCLFYERRAAVGMLTDTSDSSLSSSRSSTLQEGMEGAVLASVAVAPVTGGVPPDADLASKPLLHLKIFQIGDGGRRTASPRLSLYPINRGGTWSRDLRPQW